MELVNLPDEQIIERFARDSDHRQFAELFRRHQKNVVRQCYKRVNCADTAYDLSQEVWIRVFTKSKQYRGECPFAAWLAVIVNNRCSDHLRRDKRLLHEEISRKIVEGIEEAFVTEELAKPTVEILYEILEQISGEEKLLLTLKYEQGWSTKAIQHFLQLSESTINVRLFRAKNKLRSLFKDYQRI